MKKVLVVLFAVAVLVMIAAPSVVADDGAKVFAA